MAEQRKEGTMDWAEAYARLARLARSMEAGASTPEELRAVLDARARELARPLTPERAAGSLLEVMRFRSGGQSYALATRFVHEVLRGPVLTPLPGAPPLLCGLTLVRGEVLPVVELAPLFGRPGTGVGAGVLVVGAHRAELGLCAEELEDVVSLPADAWLPPPTALASEAGGLVSGINREGLILLEGEALLSDSRLIFDTSEEGTP